jgi:DNA-binding NtrC family response regulator
VTSMAITQTAITTFPLPLDLLGNSAPVLRAIDSLNRAREQFEPVLIVAERGFSPERIARAIHGSHGPFVRMDCGASNAEAVIRDLFGRPPGRRTDLEVIEQGSLVAQARGGTLLLANIAELPVAAQLRLSRLLRDGEVRVGTVMMSLDVRVVAAAYPGLERDVAEHRFRPELLERLQQVRIDIPPLRERIGDLACLIDAVLQEACAAKGTPRSLAPAALTALAALPWPGNLTELRDALDRLVDRASSGTIRQEDVLADLRPGASRRLYARLGSLREARLSFERDYIAAVLEDHGWRMSDAARTLGIQRANLYRKTRQLGITRVKPSRVS